MNKPRARQFDPRLDLSASSLGSKELKAANGERRESHIAGVLGRAVDRRAPRTVRSLPKHEEMNQSVGNFVGRLSRRGEAGKDICWSKFIGHPVPQQHA